MQPVIVTQVKMLLTGPSEPPPTAIIPHRMKPLVAAPEPLREVTEVVPTVAPVAPAATPPEVSIHKTVAPHPASAGASPPCLPLGYCPALRGTASFPGAGHPREGQQASLLGDKYLLLEALEGSSLHRCLHIQTQEELVCKVITFLSYLLLPVNMRHVVHITSFHISFTSRLGHPTRPPLSHTFPPPKLSHLPRINFPPPNSPPYSLQLVPTATYWGVVAVVQLHPLSFLHQSISAPTPAAPRAAGQREEPLPFSLPVLHVPMCSLPRNLLTKHHPLLRLDCRAIFAAWILFLTSGLPFLLSGFPPSWQPSSGSACLLRFCGELSGPLQWECPGSENPRREISRLCFETDFLVPQSGDKLSVNPVCMWLLSGRESEAIYSSGLFLPISCRRHRRAEKAALVSFD